MSITQWFIDELQVSVGHPPRLKRLLYQHPEICSTGDQEQESIAHSSVVRWDRFGSDAVSICNRKPVGKLLGWKHVGPYYESFHVDRPELVQISVRTVVENWTCDISQVHGFSSSKSELTAFSTTDEMVEANSQEMIDEVTSEKLQKNLAHSEIRIIHDRSRTSDHFQIYDWDKRVFLMNSGGSHHFAAAKYIALRLGEPVPLRGKLYRDRLNVEAIHSLLKDFEIIGLNDDALLINEFWDAMKQYRATWLWTHMPAPYTGNMRAIFLPKNNKRSMRVARELHLAGAFDIGSHLLRLSASQ